MKLANKDLVFWGKETLVSASKSSDARERNSQLKLATLVVEHAETRKDAAHPAAMRTVPIKKVEHDLPYLRFWFSILPVALRVF